MTASTPTAQIRIYTGRLMKRRFPHTFLAITRPDGNLIEYGLVPAEERTASGRGNIDLTAEGAGKAPHARDSEYDEPIVPMSYIRI